MTFSERMQGTVLRLLTNLGNTCTLTKTVTGSYDPSIGRTFDTTTDFPTYSTSTKNNEAVLSTVKNMGFNLTGFGEDKLLIPYIENEDVDTSWKCDGYLINSVEEIKSQDNVIAYIIEVGEK